MTHDTLAAADNERLVPWDGPVALMLIRGPFTVSAPARHPAEEPRNAIAVEADVEDFPHPVRKPAILLCLP